MALYAVFEIIYGMIETFDAGAKVVDAADAGDHRTGAPSWYSAVGGCLLVGATGAIFWPRFAALSAANPRVAAAVAILWIVAFAIVLPVTGRVVVHCIARRLPQRQQRWRPFVRRRSRER